MPSCRSVPARARSSTGHVPTQRLLRHTALRRVHCRTRRPCVRVAVAGRSCLSVAEIEHDATGSRIVGLPIWGVVRLVAWTGFHHLPGLIAPELRQLLTQERWNSRSRYRGGGLCPRVECVLKLKLVWVGSQNTLAPARGSATHTHTHTHTHTSSPLCTPQDAANAKRPPVFAPGPKVFQRRRRSPRVLHCTQVVSTLSPSHSSVQPC